MFACGVDVDLKPFCPQFDALLCAVDRRIMRGWAPIARARGAGRSRGERLVCAGLSAPRVLQCRELACEGRAGHRAGLPIPELG